MDELGIGFVAFSPLGRGVLTGGVRSLDDPAPDDARRRLPRFQPEAFAANRVLVERVERIAADKGVTVARVALARLLGQGVVPIPGTRHRSRPDENAAAAHITLSRDELRRLTEALPASEIEGGRDFAPVAEGADR